MRGRRVDLLLVDDHRLFRQGLVRLLHDHPSLRVVGEAATGQEALGRARQLRPDLVLLDLNLPDMSGIEVARLLRQECPGAQIVVLSVSERDEDLLAALQAGAMGYVPKSTDFEALMSSLQAVAAGQAALSPALTARLLARLREPAGSAALARADERLSERERQILAYLARGHSNKQIARALALSEHTVRSHITSILTKLNLENRVQAAAFALQHGLA